MTKIKDNDEEGQGREILPQETLNVVVVANCVIERPVSADTIE